MEQSKNRYELILGFVTLIISFSAFKDELQKIDISLGFYKFTLAEYLLKIVMSFGVCMYLYILERVARQSKTINTWMFINYIEKAAFIFFAFIILTPLILLAIYFSHEIFNQFTKLNEAYKELLISGFTSALGIVSGALSFKLATKYIKVRSNLRQQEIEKEEIADLENALKLYSSGFYSQAILEAFKVLELHIIRLLARKQLSISRKQYSFVELFDYAIKYNVLDKSDINTIHEIRKMRNSAAHLDTAYTAQQATKVIEFIKYLIQKTSSTSDID